MLAMLTLQAMAGCSEGYDATKAADPAANVAALDAMIRDKGKVVFRSSNGQGGWADADMDMVFLPAGQAVYSVQNIAGGTDYTGPYTIDADGMITFKPTNHQGQWSPMWLHRDKQSLYISERRLPGVDDRMDVQWPLRPVKE